MAAGTDFTNFHLPLIQRFAKSYRCMHSFIQGLPLGVEGFAPRASACFKIYQKRICAQGKESSEHDPSFHALLALTPIKQVLNHATDLMGCAARM